VLEIKVSKIRGRCPVYKVGDKMTIEEIKARESTVIAIANEYGCIRNRLAENTYRKGVLCYGLKYRTI